MEINLTGRTALVGGASRGLGKAIALQLAACGASVTLMARNEERLKAAMAELQVEAGQHHNYLVADFADFDTFRLIMENWFGNHTVDILINNTNGPSAGGVMDKSIDDYQLAFDLLFKTVCYVTGKALPAMQAKGFGRVINLTSVSVKEPLQNLVLSNTVRSAVVAWAKTLSKDVASAGITVNNILTGYFDTERLNEIYKVQSANKNVPMSELKEKMKQDIPAGRFGRPEEFGHLVAFLSSEMAGYITGASIPIDGGLLKSI